MAVCVCVFVTYRILLYAYILYSLKSTVNAAGQKYGRERPSMGGRRARGDGGHLAALRSSTSAPTGARGSWKVTCSSATLTLLGKSF